MVEIKDMMGDNFFEKECTCPKHGKYTGQAFKLGDEIIDPVCPECLLEEKEIEKQERIAREKECSRAMLLESIQSMLIDNGADVESAKVDEIYTDAVGRQRVLARTDDLINGDIRILVIIGLQGTGKTVLACNIAKKFALANNCWNVHYTKESQILRNIKSSYSKRSSEAEVMQELISKPLLIIDEITQALSEKEIVQIEDIICDRFSKRLPTVLCGNIKNSDVGRKFSSRVLSRIKGYGDVVEITGSDRRSANRTNKISLPAFRTLYTALKSESSTQFVTDEMIMTDVLNAKTSDVVSLLKAIRDAYK